MRKDKEESIAKSYMKQGRVMKLAGLLSIAMEVTLAVLFYHWFHSVLAMLVGLGVFTVASWFVFVNISKEYQVTRYEVTETTWGKQSRKIGEFTRNGSVIGGLFRMVLFYLAVVLFTEGVIKTIIFPEDVLVNWVIYITLILGLVAYSIMRDVTKIKLGHEITKAARGGDRYFLSQDIEAIRDGIEDKEAERTASIIVSMGTIIVVALLVQTIICLVQAPGIKKQLDPYRSYDSHCERNDGSTLYGDIVDLPEEWFEQALQDKDALKFSRFKTKCKLVGTGPKAQNGFVYDITMEIRYVYRDGYGWRVASAEKLGSELVSAEIPEVITGSWTGIGRDRMANARDDNEVTITLEKLTETEAIGTITCVLNGEVLYTKGFTGTVTCQNYVYEVEAVMDSLNGFWERFYFVYSAYGDTITFLETSPDMQLIHVKQ